MRFYPAAFPSLGEYLMVKVTRIQPEGVYVEILEYGNIEGMIRLDEVSRRRVRSIHGVVKKGRSTVVEVIRVDHEKGYVDLSKKHVSPEDIAACNKKFSSGKAVLAVLRFVADKTGKSVESLAPLIAWPLYETYPHAIDGLKLALTQVFCLSPSLLCCSNHFLPHSNPTILDDLNLPADVLDALKLSIARTLTPPSLKIRADIELTNYSDSGILGIQAALRAGHLVSTKEVQLQIKLIVSPLYVVVCQNAVNVESTISIIEMAIERIGEVLEREGGSWVVKMEPKIVGQVEESQLDELMEKAARDNEETSEGSSEEEE